MKEITIIVVFAVLFAENNFANAGTFEGNDFGAQMAKMTGLDQDSLINKNPAGCGEIDSIWHFAINAKRVKSNRIDILTKLFGN